MNEESKEDEDAAKRKTQNNNDKVTTGKIGEEAGLGKKSDENCWKENLKKIWSGKKSCNQGDWWLLQNNKLVINGWDAKLGEDIFIQEQVKRIVSQMKTLIGIIGHKFGAA